MRKLFLAVVALCCLCIGQPALSADAAPKSGVITYNVALNVAPESKTATLYLPYPLSDRNQDISDVKVSGNFDAQGVYHDPKTGSMYLKAQWSRITEKPVLTFSFHVNSHYTKGAALKDGGNALPVDVTPYLAANDYLPVDHPKVKELAAQATKDRTTYLDRARGVYEWTIANTHRDPDVKGCGLGQAIRTLTEANGGGKCADISSVFITVARAAGIPARDVFGLRTSGKSGDITGDFHCWAEFYLPGTGWVMVDPADVRKAMLLEKLELKDAATKERTEFFWNGDALFRIALNRGEHGVEFPGMQGAPVGYFMYPYAEVDGEALDYFDPKDFSFSVTLKAD